jgi:hypothetical protein
MAKYDISYTEEVAILTNKEDLTKLVGQGLVAVCSWCMKIRDPSGTWIDPRRFSLEYFEGRFTHTICEQCCNVYFPDFSNEFNETYQQIDV